MFFRKKQPEVNKRLLAAPGRASHGHSNKTALDENMDTAEQSDERRVQHKMLVRGVFLASFPHQECVRQLRAPTPPIRPQMCRLAPAAFCMGQDLSLEGCGVYLGWGGIICLRVLQDKRPGMALGECCPLPVLLQAPSTEPMCGIAIQPF